MHLVAYIIAKDTREANKIVNMLLKKRLIACANSWPIKSSYWWNGKIENTKEIVILGKTREGYKRKIVKEVSALHSYNIPCILFLPISSGLDEYIQWSDKELK